MENISTITYQKTNSPEQTRDIDDLLNKQEQKSTNLIHEKFKTFWNKHKIARLVTGVALAGWAIAATASWATIVAGWFIATRAILWALGGYMATDAAFDMANNKLTKNKLERLVSRMDSGETAESLETEFQEVHRELSKDFSSKDMEQEMEKAKKTHQLKKTAKKIISSVVGIGIGILGGTHVVEAVTNSNETMNLVKSKVSAIMDNKIPPQMCTAENPLVINKTTMQDIFNDIKTDHPKQGYVTLEQTVRRVEWLKQGIDLDHSSLLKKFNTSVYDLVRDPSGDIVRTMKEMAILAEWQTVDEVAKHLTEGQISKIIEKTYGTQFITDKAILDSWVTDVTGSNTLPAPSIGEKPEEIAQKSSALSSWFTGLGLIGAGLLGWLGWKKFGKDEKKTGSDTMEVSRPATTSTESNTEIWTPEAPVVPAENISIIQPPSSPESRPPATERNPISETPSESDNSHSSDSSSQEDNQLVVTRPTITSPVIEQSEWDSEKLAIDSRNRKSRFYNFMEMIGKYFLFTHLSGEYSDIVEETGFGKIVFIKSTLGWEFRASYIQSPTKNGEIELSWFDHGTKKSTITRTLSSPNQMALTFERMYIEMLKKRDEIKCQEMLSLHTVEVSEQDLRKMYQQLEHPYVLQNDTETGGYWFQSCYGLHNGVLRFENLVNPTMDEMNITGGSFWIKIGTDYIWRNKTIFLRGKFEEKERQSIVDIHNTTHSASLKTGQERMSMTGAVNHYNYHKHPGYLNHPSIMDLNHPSAWRARFEEGIDTKVLTWFIVNELPSNVNETNKPRNSHILRRSRYGWKKDYIVNFWKVHRNATNSNYKISDCIPLDYRII